MNADRIARVARNMEGAGLAQIVVASPPSIEYLTGIRIDPGERLFALLLDSGGGATLYANRLLCAGGSGVPTVEFDDADDGLAILAKGLKRGAVGIDKDWRSRFALGLMEARPDLRVVLGSAPVDRARMIKDAAELGAMRAAVRANDLAMGGLIASLRIGVAEIEAAEAYLASARAMGAAAAFPPLVCFGEGGASPHHAPGRAVLRAGDAAVLDVGLSLSRGLSDLTRTVFMGAPSARQREVYEIVIEANAAARAAVAPGVPLSEIDLAARRVIARAGYGDRFTHRTGHGIGMEVHEPPDVRSNSGEIAEPGMTFSIEPGIYLPGEFGVRIEDLVAVTADGCETLSAFPRELAALEP